MVSAEGTDRAVLQLVRLIHGDENPEGPGFIEREVDAPVNGTHAVAKQYTQLGSFVRVTDPESRLAAGGPFTLWAYIWARTPAKGRQGILTRWQDADSSGYALEIGENGALAFRVGDGSSTDALAADIPLIARQWYLVAASYDPASSEATLYQEPIENRYNNHLSKIVPLALTCHASGQLGVTPAAADADFLWAAAQDRAPERGAFATHLYNGKIDRAGVAGAVLSREVLDRAREAGGAPATGVVIAAWDTTAGYSATGIGDTVVDTSPHGLHGEGHNRPVRGMTGFNWNGHDDCFRYAPAQFGGIEFHEDAITDCGWEPTISMAVPDLKSGVYAARLRAGEAEEHVVFFLRPEGAHGAHRDADPHLQLPRLRQRAHRPRHGDRAGAEQPGDRHPRMGRRAAAAAGIRRLLLRQPPRWCGDLLHHPAPADLQHAAPAPDGARCRALAVSRRTSRSSTGSRPWATTTT